MGKTIEAIIALKDNLTPGLKNMGVVAKASFAGLSQAANAANVGLEAMARGVGFLRGDYAQLGNLLRMIPGPIGAIAGTVGDALGSVIGSTSETISAFTRLSLVTGASTSFLSLFSAAADDVFVSQEAVNAGLERFARNLGGVGDAGADAMVGAKPVADVLREIGVASRDSSGKLRSMESMLPEIADVFQRMGPSSQAAATAVALFGKRGAELIPILIEGRAGLEDMMKAAKDAGQEIDQSMVAANIRLKQSQDALNDSMDVLSRKLGTVLIPLQAELTDEINGAMNGTYRPFLGWLNKAGYYTDWLTHMQEEQNRVVAGSRAGMAEKTKEVKKSAAEMEAWLGVATKNTRELRDNSEATADAVAWGVRMAAASRATAEAQAALAASIGNVGAALGSSTQAYDKAALAQIAYKLATGQMTMAQFEQGEAARALMAAYEKGRLSLSQVTAAAVGLAGGTLTTSQAFDLAGKSARGFEKQVGQVKDALVGIPSPKPTITVNAAPAIAAAAAAKTAMTAIPNVKPVISIGGSALPTIEQIRQRMTTIQSKTVTVTVRQQTVYMPTVTRCFAAGTLISMADGGECPIEDIRAGALVIAYDHDAGPRDAGRQVAARVARTFSRRAPFMQLALTGDVLVSCTPEHPFWCLGQQAYTPAKFLRPGDALLALDGRQVLVLGTPAAGALGWGTCEVYNFEVEGHHNYFASGVLVHNASMLMTADDYARVEPRGVVHVDSSGRAETVNNYNLTINSQARTEDVRANYEMLKLLYGRK